MEERIKKLEGIVKRLIRKSVKKTVSAVITPYPISNCVVGDDVGGTVLKYMFAARGVINKGLVRFDKKFAAGVRITVLLEGDLGGQSKSYIVNRNQMMVEPDLEVFSGDRLTVSVNPNDPENGVLNEVWVAFIWTPHVGEATVKSFLIDKLDEIEAPEEEGI